MRMICVVISFAMLLGNASPSSADAVVLGFPLDYVATGALNPGLGEAVTAETVTRMGQTFTVPAGYPILTDFSFWLGDSPIFDPQPTTFEAVLMGYGIDRPVGPVFYQSGMRSTVGLLHGENRRFDFHVGMELTPGESYIMFLDVTSFLDGVANFATLTSPGADVYTGGMLVQSSATSGLGHVSDTAWLAGGLDWDLVFRARFRAVPEPNCIALLGCALCAAPFLRRPLVW
jgi:hypothetical protein